MMNATPRKMLQGKSCTGMGKPIWGYLINDGANKGAKQTPNITKKWIPNFPKKEKAIVLPK